jgi:hypothetical protein
MKQALITGFMAAAAALAVSGCAVKAGGQQAPPPPPDEAVASAPTFAPPQPTETPETAEEGGASEGPVSAAVPAGKAEAGEVLFVRDSQIWAVTPGGEPRPITAFEGAPVIRDLAISPDGRRLAFTLDGAALGLLDLMEGLLVVIDDGLPSLAGFPTWSQDSRLLYYQRIIFDASSVPSTSEIWWMGMQPGDYPEPVHAVRLADGTEIAPLFALEERLVMLELAAGEEPSARLLLYDPEGGVIPQTGDLGALSILDISPERDRVLAIDQLEPAHLFVAAYGLEAGIGEPEDISPEEGAIYTDARFAPDGAHIAALLYVASEGGLTSRALALTPQDDGTTAAITLAAGTEGRDAALVWYGSSAVILQRIPPDGGASELWLAPIDGQPGSLITTGEQPVVVPGS